MKTHPLDIASLKRINLGIGSVQEDNVTELALSRPSNVVDFRSPLREEQVFPLTPSLEEYQSLSFPKSADEMEDRFLKVPNRKKLDDWKNLLVDLAQALYLRQTLGRSLEAPKADEEKVEGVSVIFNSGLYGWRGSETLAKSVPWPLNQLFEGTYAPLRGFFEPRGYRYREAWGKFGIQTGNYEGPDEALENAIDEEMGYSDLVVVIGHSFGGLLAQDYAARHPDRAKQLLYILGGAPSFPFEVNYCVAESVVTLHGTRNFHRLRAASDFVQREREKTKFVNIVAAGDKVIRGPIAPGETVQTQTGHSAIFFQRGNLEFIDSTIRSEQLERRNGHRDKTDLTPLHASAAVI